MATRLNVETLTDTPAQMMNPEIDHVRFVSVSSSGCLHSQLTLKHWTCHTTYDKNDVVMFEPTNREKLECVHCQYEGLDVNIGLLG